jgi:hypothetical protein
MSNLYVFVAGSIHQGSERFYSDILRGRQCSFMSFSAFNIICSDFVDITVDLACEQSLIFVSSARGKGENKALQYSCFASIAHVLSVA